MDITIINGPNLNLLGQRETAIYGTQSFDDYFNDIKEVYVDLNLNYIQSNIEGEIIDALQQAARQCKGIVLNAAGFTHTSVAIRDAIAAIDCPVIEVHISNPYAREDFRQQSVIAPVCRGLIAGFGLESYTLALDHFLAE